MKCGHKVDWKCMGKTRHGKPCEGSQMLFCRERRVFNAFLQRKKLDAQRAEKERLIIKSPSPFVPLPRGARVKGENNYDWDFRELGMGA